MYNIKNYFEINYSKYPFIPTNPNSDYALMYTSGILGGGLIGGVSSGIQGGISAKQNGGNFWTGKGVTFDFKISSNAIEGNQKGTEVEFNTKSENQFKDKYFDNVKGVDKLIAENKLDPRMVQKGYKIDGYKIYHGNDEVGGTTINNGIGKGSDVFLFKTSFYNEPTLYIAMGHEFIHATFNYNGLYNVNKNIQHAITDSWGSEQLKLWGNPIINPRISINPYLYESNYNYSYEKFMIKFITWPFKK